MEDQSAATSRDFLSNELRNPGIDDKCCATATLIGVDINRLNRTIYGTGSAFDTCPSIDDLCLVCLKLKNPVWTNKKTGSTAHTQLNVELKYGKFFQIA